MIQYMAKLVVKDNVMEMIIPTLNMPFVKQKVVLKVIIT